MMRDLIVLGSIVGDGTHAAEVVEVVERVNAVRPTWNLLGYIVDDQAKQQGNGYKVLGGPEAIARFPDACFVSVAGRPPTDRVPADRLVSLVDPTSFVSRTARLGRGVIVFPHCYIGLNAEIGDRCFMLAGCVVNHDVVLEEKTVLASAVAIAGSVRVGAGSYLGQSCSIRERLRVGRNCLIGMGAVVTKDVPDDSVMVGNPAQRLRSR